MQNKFAPTRGTFYLLSREEDEPTKNDVLQEVFYNSNVTKCIAFKFCSNLNRDKSNLNKTPCSL
jgi:hypothetical protein